MQISFIKRRIIVAILIMILAMTTACEATNYYAPPKATHTPSAGQ